jgi:hypothetical protein
MTGTARRSPALAVSLAVALALAAGLAGCAPPPRGEPVAVTASDGRGAIRPLPVPTGSTSTATDRGSVRRALDHAAPGAVICVLGDLHDTRLVLTRSGAPGGPIRILGDGRTLVDGITVHADNVIVSGLNAIRPRGPGISLTGSHITLQNSTSISPRGDDGDGLRFFGTDITVAHNTIRDTRNLHFAHADCMQTFATDPARYPASRHIWIADNRCERIANMCLIAEGPNSLAGDGSGQGQSADFTFSNNYCETHADQATEIDDVQRVTITNNIILGDKPMAFSFQNHATEASVADNQIAATLKYLVGMDPSSRAGYRGPAPGGKP